jgi:hypothetical protein
MNIKRLAKSTGVAMALVLVPAAALAINPGALVNDGIKSTGLSAPAGGIGGIIKNIINVIIFAVGVASVFMIVIGALRMVLSNGNPANIKAARETILYAAAGLAIAIASFAIAQFVSGCVGGGGTCR